jgi:hypothetical protein
MLNLNVINQICFNKLESNFVCRTRTPRIHTVEHHFELIRNGYTVAPRIYTLLC